MTKITIDDLALMIESSVAKKEDVVQLDGRMGNLEQRMGALEQRMDNLERRMDSLDQRMGALEQRMDGLERRMDGLELRFNKLEERMEQGFLNIMIELKSLRQLVIAMDKSAEIEDLRGRMGRLEKSRGLV